MVGNKIRLGLQSRPPGQTISNPQWTIPGTIVKNYTQSPTTGTKTDVAAADLQSLSIDFFWIDDGSQNVSVTATVMGVALNPNVTFEVQRPTVNHFTATTSSVNVCLPHTYIRPGTWLAAYDPHPGGTPGCQWDAQVTAPPLGAGQVGFTQRIQPHRVVQDNDGTTGTLSSPSMVLDAGNGKQYNGAKPVLNSNSVTMNGLNYADSPAAELTNLRQSSSGADSFELYLMYQSSEADSIWVTLSMLTWQWAGATTRIGAPASTANNWNAATGTSLSATASSRTNTLPEWTTNMAALTWTV